MLYLTLDGELSAKDKDRSEVSNSLNALFICIQIVCSVMKEVGESVDTENGSLDLGFLL